MIYSRDAQQGTNDGLGRKRIKSITRQLLKHNAEIYNSNAAAIHSSKNFASNQILTNNVHKQASGTLTQTLNSPASKLTRTPSRQIRAGVAPHFDKTLIQDHQANK